MTINTVEEFKEMFQSLPVGLYRTSIETGEFIEANPKCAQMFGYDSAEEMKKKSVAFDFYQSKKDRKEFIDSMKSNGGSIPNYEILLVDSKGNNLWVAVTGRINEDKGYIEGTVMCISDRKEMERQLNLFKSKEASNLHDISEIAKRRVTEIDTCCNGHFHEIEPQAQAG